jgi:Zn-finger protein
MPHDFYQNPDCPFMPCHKCEDVTKFSCQFCFCPLYHITDCGGNCFILPNGIKDCSACTIPHFNYKFIIDKLAEVYHW